MFRLRRNRQIVCVETGDEATHPAWSTMPYFTQHLRARAKDALRARKNGGKHLFDDNAEIVVYDLVEVSRESVIPLQTSILMEEQSKQGR